MSSVAFSVPILLLAIWAAHRAAGRHDCGTPLGTWRKLCFGFMALLGAEAARSFGLASPTGPDSTSVLVVHEVSRILGYAFMVWAVICLSGFIGSEVGRLRWYVDTGLVVAAVSILLFYPSATPHVERYGASGLLLLSLRSLENLLLVLALALLLVRRPPVALPIVTLLGLGLAGELAANLVLTYSAHTRLVSVPAPVLAIRTAALASLVLSAFLASLAATLGMDRTRGHLTEINPLPYLAPGAVLLVVTTQFVTHADEPSGRLVLSLGCLSAALILRQFLIQRETVVPAPQSYVRRYEDRLQALLTHSSDLMLVITADGAIRYLSPSVQRLLVDEPKEVWNRSFFDLLHPDDVAETRDLLSRAVTEMTGVTLRGEWRLRDRRGEWLHVEGVITNHLREPGILGLLLNVRDVTERKLLEGKLVHQALHDSLTGLANRSLLLNRLEHALARAKRQGQEVGLLFLDLDDFKQVNDTLGHAEGDGMLTEIAKRLVVSCRETDTIARLGGDEFAVLLEEAPNLSTAQYVAGRVIEALHEPYPSNKGVVLPSTSIGIALAGSDVTPEELLRRADIAMYAAKGMGKDAVRVFDSSMDEPLQRRAKLEAELREAVKRWDLCMYYQPIIALPGGEVVGVEVLLRWDHPELGMLLPGEFLHLAERAGVDAAIRRKVLLDACTEVAGWKGHNGGRELFLSVNVSRRQIRDDGLMVDVRKALSVSRLSPKQLVLEFTERTLREDEGLVRERLDSITATGVRIAVDDFGTKYSSLSSLRDLPVQVLKLDRSFIEDCTRNGASLCIIAAVCELAHSLGLQVVAEGVESAEQHRDLVGLGCDFAQGYHYLPPRPCYETREYVRTQDQRAAEGAVDGGGERKPLDKLRVAPER